MAGSAQRPPGRQKRPKRPQKHNGSFPHKTFLGALGPGAPSPRNGSSWGCHLWSSASPVPCRAGPAPRGLRALPLCEVSRFRDSPDLFRDTLAGDPKLLQADAETYYEKLLKKSSSIPDTSSIPGGEKVQTFAERIVLFVLNYVIFGMLEGSSANDAFFLPHSATECAKILWRDGEAVAFYTVKMKGKAVHLICPEDEEGSWVEYAQSSKLRQSAADDVNKGVEYISDAGKVAEDAVENKNDAAAATNILNPQDPGQEDLE